jgi:hypothetical protein
MADVPPRRSGNGLFASGANHARQRREAHSGLDLSTSERRAHTTDGNRRCPAAELRSHTHRRERSHVPARCQSCGRARAGNGKGNLAASSVEYKPSDLVAASDTTAEHAAACKELVEKEGVYNAGPFTPWAYRAEGAPAKRTVNSPSPWLPPIRWSCIRCPDFVVYSLP